jgi:hypothetical protein
MNLSEAISKERREMMIETEMWKRVHKECPSIRPEKPKGPPNVPPPSPPPGKSCIEDGAISSPSGKLIGYPFLVRHEEDDKEMRKLSQLIKEMSPEEILKRVDQSLYLMGVIVEKLDEISMKLDNHSTLSYVQTELKE